MLKLMGKKIFSILRCKVLFILTYVTPDISCIHIEEHSGSVVVIDLRLRVSLIWDSSKIVTFYKTLYPLFRTGSTQEVT